jgi:predicted PhzF superfamily epimerase YddE/YHI9
MRKYLFMQVDAFTDVALGGNPCAIFFDTQDLDAQDHARDEFVRILFCATFQYG